MNKYKIGDILRAKKNIKLSSWALEKYKKGIEMQVAEVNIKLCHDNSEKVYYQLCLPEKAPYFVLDGDEEFIDDNFEFIKHDQIEYCSEWKR